MKSGLLATSLWLPPSGLRCTHSNLFLTNLSRSRYWPHPQVLGIWQLYVPLMQQFSPRAVLCLLAHPAFRIRQALRRAVGLVMKPEDVRSIHAANTGQRIFFNTIFLSNWLHLLNPHASQRIQRILVNIYPLCQIY